MWCGYHGYCFICQFILNGSSFWPCFCTHGAVGQSFLISCHLSGFQTTSHPDLYRYHFKSLPKTSIYRIVNTSPRARPPSSSHVNKRPLLDFHSPLEKEKKKNQGQSAREKINRSIVGLRMACLSRKLVLLQGSDQWHCQRDWQRPSHSFSTEGEERGLEQEAERERASEICREECKERKWRGEFLQKRLIISRLCS